MQKEKIKVMQLLHGFSVGGAEKMVKQYCELFDKEKIDLVVLCVQNHCSVLDKELGKMGVRIIYINDVIDRYIWGPILLRRAIHYCLRKYLMRYYIKKEEPDIIHSHLGLNDFLLKAKPNRSTKLFYTVHFDSEKLKKGWIGRKNYRAITMLCKKYDMTIIALHEDGKKELKNMFNNAKIVVLNNGIDIKVFQHSATKEKLRAEFKVKEDLMVVGHVGGLRPVKNHNFLLDIFIEIIRKRENVQLWIVGDGILSEYLKKKVMSLGINNKVIFWGIRNDIPDLMKMMDIIVFPSLNEGLSLTLVEAQIACIPALVSDSVAAETAFSNYIHFYSLQKSAVEWASKVFQILENKERVIYKNIEKWDIKNNVRTLEKIYAEGLEERR